MSSVTTGSPQVLYVTSYNRYCALTAGLSMMTCFQIPQPIHRLLAIRVPAQHTSRRWACWQNCLCTVNFCLAVQDRPSKLFRLPYRLQGDRFKLATQAFDRQYAHIYFQRLMLMKPPLLKKVRQKWPGVQRENKLICLSALLNLWACRFCPASFNMYCSGKHSHAA